MSLLLLTRRMRVCRSDYSMTSARLMWAVGRLRDRARELEERRRGTKVGPNVMTTIDMYVLALGRPTGSWVSV